MPPFIVNQSQPRRVSLWYPHGVYSRVHVLNVTCGGANPAAGYVIGPPVGNECWLRQVQVWCHQLGESQNVWGYVRICAGTDRGASLAQVRDQWQRVITGSGMGLKDELYVYEKNEARVFDMNVHFNAGGLCFAVYAYAGNPIHGHVFSVSFEFTEG